MSDEDSLAPVRTLWQAMPAAHRWLVAAYALLALSLAMPWYTGEPFMNGFMGAPEEPREVLSGYEAAFPVAVLAPIGLATTLFAPSGRMRVTANLVVFGIAAAMGILTATGTPLGCILCSDIQVLEGTVVGAGAGLAGLALTLAGVDWRRLGASSGSQA